MKTIVLGDTHGRDAWKTIVTKENPDRVIFIGDYFDSFDVGYEDQINNFLDICAFKEAGEVEVIMLIGNHDHHYFKQIGNTGTSGYQHNARYLIENAIDNHKDKLQMAYSTGKYLFTHAGVGEEWLKRLGYAGKLTTDEIVEFVNDVWKHKPLAFLFDGTNPYGDDIGQTPIWIRPRSLKTDSKGIKNITQVVGHTSQENIKIDEGHLFIDTLGTSKEYLIIKDGKISTAKYETESKNK